MNSPHFHRVHAYNFNPYKFEGNRDKHFFPYKCKRESPKFLMSCNVEDSWTISDNHWLRSQTNNLFFFLNWAGHKSHCSSHSLFCILLLLFTHFFQLLNMANQSWTTWVINFFIKVFKSSIAEQKGSESETSKTCPKEFTYTDVSYKDKFNKIDKPLTAA